MHAFLEDSLRSTPASLAHLPFTFTAAQARRAGMAPRNLYRLRDRDDLAELSRGVFRKADAPATAHLDLLAIASRAPRAVVCLVSALALHELIDDVPERVHIAVPRGTHTPSIDFPPVAVSRFDADTFGLGIESFEAAPGEYVRVYSPARSVVDAMRLRHNVGESLALHATRAYLSRPGADPAGLLQLAAHLRATGPILRTVEAVLA